MKFFYVCASIALLPTFALSMEGVVTKEDCACVLSFLNKDVPHVSLSETHDILEDLFDKRQIKDYADAARYGRENNTFNQPDEFSNKMNQLFRKNEGDSGLIDDKKYQALVLNSSGIDVFMERLALLARMLKKGIKTDRIIALIGDHTHRKDLMDIDYLINLPYLFEKDFDLENFDKEQSKRDICDALEQKEWQHKHGMELAWKLLSCDKNMNELSKKFEFFNASSYPPSQLLKQFFASGLQHPIDSENSVGFVVNCQAATTMKERIKEHAGHNDAIDMIVAKPADNDIEARLFNDTSQQRAMTKLFQFYRLLKAVC